MQQYLPYLRQSLLFERIDDEGLVKTLNCLNAQIIACEKGKVILHQGDEPRHFGVVLCGSVNVVASDSYGNHSVMWSITQGDLFGETYVSAGVDSFPASFVAAQDSMVLILEYARVITGCRNNGCLAHSYLVTNLIRSIGKKNLTLTQKLEFVTQRTTRDKLMAYLRAQQKQAKSHRFVIPYDRQTLADYLGVERSAMSAELSRMKRDGLIHYRKNEFEILLP
ncbi:MAG: Crp/Fnr family transcriptional regulator [Clostridia bacterium]|nr:Crp/Fnr family transcriptional regulator [Clostridia bacterium]